MSLKINIDTGAAVTSADAFAKAIQRLAVSTKLLGGSADEVMRMTKSMARRFSAIAKAAGTVGEASEKASKGMDKVAKSTNKAGDAAARATSKTNKYASSIRTMIGAYVGIRSVRVVVKTLAELDQGLTTLGSVTASTSEELKVLEATAVRVAQATKFTPKETIRALLELSRAGQDAATAADSLASVTALAAAGVLDLGVAAGLTAATMAQYKSQSVGAAEVAATFVAVADRTKSTVLTLGSAMGQAGQAAAQFGIGIEQTVVAVGQLQTAGIQASRSGRAIKTILSSLATANKRSRSRTALEQMGLDADDLVAKEGDLIGLFETINNATKDFSAQKRVGILTSLVGKDFFAILAEAMASTEEMRNLQSKLGDKRAELLEKERQQNDTLTGSILGVTSAYQEMLLVAGSGGLTGTLKTLLNTMAGSIRILGGVDGALASASDASARLAKAMKSIGIAIAAAAAFKLASMLVGLTKTVWGLVTANRALALSNPYTAIVTAVAAVTAAIFVMGDAQDKVHRDNLSRLAKEKAIRTADLGSVKTSFEKFDSRGEQKSADFRLTQSQAAQGGATRIFDAARAQSRKDSADGTGLRGSVNAIQLAELVDALKGNSRDIVQAAIDREKLQKINAKAIEKFTTQIEALDNTRKTKSGPSRLGSRVLRKTPLAKGVEQVEAERILKRFKDSIGPVIQIPIKLLNDMEQEAKVYLSGRSGSISEEIRKSQDASGPTGGDLSGASESSAASKSALALADFKSATKVALAYDKIKIAIEEGNLATSERVTLLKDQIKAEKLIVEIRKDDDGKGLGLEDEKNVKTLISLTVDRKSKLMEVAQIKRDEAEADRAHASAVKGFLRDSASDIKDGIRESEEKEAQQVRLNEYLKEEIQLREIALIAIKDPELAAAMQARIDAVKERLKLGQSQADADAGGEAASKSSGVLAQAVKDKNDLDDKKAEAKSQAARDQQKLQALGEQVGSQFANAFDAIVSGSKSAKEAFADMARDMVKQLVQIAIKKAIVAAIGSAFGGGAAPAAANQQGGVINNQQGGTIPAQLGQIISSPTTIQRGGKNFSVSEGGGSTPEAVFPLVKNAKGQLGIGGAGGGGTVNHFNFPGIKSGEEARKAKRTMGQQVASVMAATQAKKNKAGMRPK
jgi:TP901 family phage tail tape measure protein